MDDLLFLVQRIPYPPNKGEKIRHFQLYRHLCARYRVHLGCFVDDPEDLAYVPVVSAMAADSRVVALDRRRAKLLCLRGLVTGQALTLPYFRSHALARWTSGVLTKARPRVAVVCSSSMGQYVMKLQPPLRPPRLVMDFCDVDSAKWQAYAAGEGVTFAGRLIYRREAARLLAFERRAADAADAVTFASPAEAELFRGLAPESAAKTWPVANGVDADYFSPDRHYDTPYPDGRPVLVFTGTMDYWPNVDAVTWFAREVLPLVRRAVWGAEFWIVGASPAPAVQALASLPGVRVTGRVADVRPYLAHAALAVAPLRIARGIQNKVLEAMAMARPVLVTPAALEGIDAVPGGEVAVATDPAALALAAVRVMATGAAAAAMGALARRRVVEHYGWAARLADFDRLLRPPRRGEEQTHEAFHQG